MVQILGPKKTAADSFTQAFIDAWDKAQKYGLEYRKEKKEEEKAETRWKQETILNVKDKSMDRAIQISKKMKVGGFLGMGKRSLTLTEIDALSNQIYKQYEETGALPSLEESGEIAKTTVTETDDLQTFINSEEERNALKEANPEVYKQFLEKAQAQGALTDIGVEAVQPAPERKPVLPPTAGPEAQLGEKTFGKVRELEQQRQAGIAKIPGAATGMVSQGIGGLGQGYNVLAGGVSGASGVPQQTIPQPVLDMMRQGQLFKKPFENLQTSGAAFGEGFQYAGDYYKKMIQRMMKGK